jgi:hypothetical protein
MKAVDAKKKLTGFKPVDGCHLNFAQAERYGRRLLELAQANNDTVTKEQVVEDARRLESPLHEYFEWDDQVAAHSWRLEQAGYIIRSIRVVYEDPDDGQARQELPVLVNVRIDYQEDKPDPWPEAPLVQGAKQAYVTTSRAMTDEDMLKDLLRQILRDIQTFEAKYGQVNHPAVQELFQAIQRTKDKLLNALKPK